MLRLGFNIPEIYFCKMTEPEQLLQVQQEVQNQDQVEANVDGVKSLLEAPIEKPVLLSDAALENLYNISHNIQENIHIIW